MRQLSFESEISLSSPVSSNVISNSHAIESPLSGPVLPARSVTTKQFKTTEKGSYSELSLGRDSALQASQLLPLLANHGHQQRWLMWFSPRPSMNKQWAASSLLADLPIMHSHCPSNLQLAWCLRAVESGNHHVLIEWQGRMSKSARQQLRAAAEATGTQLMVINKEDK